MINKLSHSILIFITASILVFVVFNIFLDQNTENAPTLKVSDVVEEVEPKKETVGFSRLVLDVPYESEAPEGKWVQPWANACEEATIMMIDRYYQGKKSASISEAKIYLQNLFEKEEMLFGTSRNASGIQILEIINSYTSFDAVMKDNPTIDDIKKEIIAGRPVLSLHRGFDLKNPNIDFAPTKSSYHTLVVVGFDDLKKVFITHDPGDVKSGLNYAYSYDMFMNSLHDYDIERDKADGPARAIFTSSDL